MCLLDNPENCLANPHEETSAKLVPICDSKRQGILPCEDDPCLSRGHIGSESYGCRYYTHLPRGVKTFAPGFPISTLDKAVPHRFFAKLNLRFLQTTIGGSLENRPDRGAGGRRHVRARGSGLAHFIV